MTESRREHLRMPVRRTVWAADVETGEELTVVDLSLGGMAVETALVLTPSRERNLRLHATTGEQLLVRVRVIYVARPAVRDGHETYRAGLEFLPLPAASRTWIHEQIVALQRFRSRGPGGGPPIRAVSRRQLPRFEASNTLAVRIDERPVPMTLYDIGPGGFAVDGLAAFSRGTVHGITFTSAEGLDVRLRAQVAHSRVLTASRSREVWRTGFQFLIDGDDVPALSSVLDHATSALRFL